MFSDGRGPLTVFESLPLIYEAPVTPLTGSWWLNETLVYLTHLELQGQVERVAGEPERWTGR